VYARSYNECGVENTEPAAMWPGQMNIVGTLRPPSYMVLFMPRSPPAERKNAGL